MKNKRGGPGRGQGRKPLKAGEKTVSISFRGTEAQRDRLKALGGGEWVRDLLDSARIESKRELLAEQLAALDDYGDKNE